MVHDLDPYVVTYSPPFQGWYHLVRTPTSNFEILVSSSGSSPTLILRIPKSTTNHVSYLIVRF